ncbi:MAG TPA: argininosuccinate lyase, partial [Chloroflexota bacterium]|nr:argininosuccinate lyase [Chloroflexota bacterium]
MQQPDDQPADPNLSPSPRPRERLWGSRFSAEPDRLVREFTQSIDFDQRLFGQDILGSIAHCRMLGRQGILTVDEARTIVGGLRQVGDEAERGAIPLDHALEDVHTHVETRLREIVGSVAGKLHTARSRNDQIALDLRLFLREVVLDVIDALTNLQDVLHERAAAWRDVVIPGFTHLQRAQPVLLGHHLLAYHEMFRRDAERCQDAYRRVNVLPLGVGALAGVPYPIDRQYVADLLAFDDVSRNSLDTVGDRDFVVEFLADASMVMAHLSRLAEEIILWTTSEFAYLALDDRSQPAAASCPRRKT